MPTQVQFRRGNTSQHSTFTGAEGEITVNTEKDILVVHDGSTVSGHEVARVNNPYFNGTVNVANVTFSNSLHPNSNGTHSIGNGTFRWEKLWLSNSGISIGVNGHTITSNSTTFVFTQNVTTNDSFIIVQGATVGPVVNTSGFYGNVTANALNVGGDVTITGNLIVTGTTFTVNTTTLDVKDLNITVAKGALDASAANGAGITIDGVNATILYTSATNTFNFSNYINVGNSTVNATVNATSFTGDSATVGGNTASNLNTYADNKAANAYSNAVSYADGRIIDSVTNTSIAYAASANSVKNAYDRAIDANTRAASAQTEASSAYTNAASYADAKASNAYSNAVAYANSLIIDSVTNTSIAYAASANSVKNAYDRAIDANTRAYSAQTEASAAYTNAAIFASNASNINTGTLAEARLPYRMDQDVQTTDNIQFNNLTLSGNLVVNGGVVTLTGNTVTFTDNMFYMNQGILATITNIVGNGSVVTVTANNNFSAGWDVFISDVNPSAYNGTHSNILSANSTTFTYSDTTTTSYVSGGTARGKTDSNPDLGFAAGYNDGTYHHAGFFRDASDGIWKVFDNYSPEPDISVFIDTANTSFHLANFQANTLYLGNTSTNWLVSNTSGVYHTGIMNAASFTVDATFIANSSGVFVGANVSSTVTTITVGNSTVNTAVTAGVVGRTDVIDTFISNTTATVSQTAIDSFSATTYRSAKYIVQATNSTNYHYTEVAVVHDGTAAYATEFATMFTGSSLVSFAVDISGGNVRLLATAANATTTTYKIDRKLIKV